MTGSIGKTERVSSRSYWVVLTALALLIVSWTLLPDRTRATDQSCTTLDVSGESVRICRDTFGRPHIFAATNRGLFEAYGYVVAQDRLWQLELNRRAARGRLAEILGSDFASADRAVRTVGYTDAELDGLFNRLNTEEQGILTAYRDGINRYVTQVIRTDPARYLPFEFQILSLGLPEPWDLRDSVAFSAFMTRRFGEIGGRELTNQNLLNSLIATHGETVGYEIFNDVRWLNDPDAPVTIPADAPGGQCEAPNSKPATSTLNQAQLLGASEDWPEHPLQEARRLWESIGVVTKLGSYAWVVNSDQSAEGAPLLYGGPQMGFSVPEVLHEVQLTGGNGFNTTGMAFAGVPGVLIGRNDKMAWTSTTATGDNNDVYIETLCDDGNGYQFQGACRPFERRVEQIRVRGGDPVAHTVLRSVHGPVISTTTGFAATEKKAHWLREIDSIHAFMAFGRTRRLEDFAAAVQQIVTSHNFLYADQEGNIAYWQAGVVPIRPEGFDTRLPLPGDGSAEWPGGALPIPTSINPARGWLTNWNNKPCVTYDNADEQIFGRQNRLTDIEQRLAAGPVSLADMRDIPKDIARINSSGREARYLRSYLMAALAAIPPTHTLAAQAQQVLTAWDGSAFADAVTSTNLLAGEVIFSEWLSIMRTNTFRAALGDSQLREASTNMLIHVLDDALGEGSGVPPSRDYFNGADPNVVMSNSFDQALTSLGSDPAAWSNRPRGTTNFNHPIIGSVGSIPRSNRATYGQIVVLKKPAILSENIFSLGQSGFIGVVGERFELDPHFRDQLDLFRNFQYKPMRLTTNP